MILLVAVFAVGVVVGMAAGLLLAIVWLTETAEQAKLEETR